MLPEVRRKKVNWIFWSVLMISLAVHAVILIRVSGLYQAGHQQILNFWCVTLQNRSSGISPAPETGK